MKLGLDSWSSHLRGPELAPAYLVSGDEPLQLGEAVDALRARARELGFTERAVHFVERGFDWDVLRNDASSMSLFGDRRLLEIRMPSGKPGTQGAAALQALLDPPAADVVLLVITDKLDFATQKAQWLRAIEAAGVWLNVPEVAPARLAEWLRGRCRAAGLSSDDDALRLLAERVEGNLLAAHQEIQKLALLHPGARLDVDMIAGGVADSSRFDVYALGDAALVGDTARALHILDVLQGEGVEPTLTLWALTREMRTLWALRTGSSLPPRGYTPPALLDRARPRVARLSFARLIARAARTDRMIKGRLHGDPWSEMMLLVAELCGQRMPAPAPIAS
ncbi:MAG: DNA polymerase III subunit delta [Steroidobacteraceae bacterium]